ncbi:hypothetical protein [Leptospira kmetyi]|uniref:Uncharacterized protein n=1 Tax=Leptospira kmetyi TaxID=408139 RepID=A0ABX4ND77_9LEPT|nr:hypothetical protein [Leptospira kmetyi]EQA51702.1 hypothetical protein LEP1GSC052_3024 [Leptospira kmetyi serovar Malaysia str. Bejo-Iso9]PJZ29405.1 hypothetical protein CH378_12640 [Leptospira kmetyi]
MISKSYLSKILTLIFPIAILSGNLYLYNTTKNRIETFTVQPPFLAFDFTNSYLGDRNSRISHLLDQNPTTTWTKRRPSTAPEDFLVELRQTHHLANGKPAISKWKTLHVVGCKQTVGEMKLDLILRESIDMDKELRLPKDQLLGERILNFSESKHFSIPLDSYYKPEATEEFPQKMFIWTVKGTWPKEKSDAATSKTNPNEPNKNAREELCLEDIWLSEN